MRQRLWAAVALASVLVAIGLAIWIAVEHFPNGLTVLACGLGAVWSAWYGLRRRGLPRAIGICGAGLFVGAAIVLIIIEGRALGDLLLLAALAGGLAAARQAFQFHADLPRARRPRHAVLFYNPLSGGGKAQALQTSRGSPPARD